MFWAAFTSRSWISPQAEHPHSLTPRPAIPLGLSGRSSPVVEQVWVVKVETSSISWNTPPCLLAL